MMVSDNTIAAEMFDNFFKNLGKTTAKYFTKIANNAINVSSGAFERLQ